MKKDRRKFLRDIGYITAGLGLTSGMSMPYNPNIWTKDRKEAFFEISLAEWSLHRTIKSGKLKNMDFPEKAKNTFHINAVEYVDQFFLGKAQNMDYLNELKKRTIDLNVRNVLIMVDTAGALAVNDESSRIKAVENHYQWINAAKFLGCHSIRVNLKGAGSLENLTTACVDSLGRLVEYGATNSIGIIVENHGGISSNGEWLSNIIRQVDHPFCGTLPDFDNWCISLERTGSGKECADKYDPYLGLAELMPYAKGVSAKSRDFDEQGNEANMNFEKLIGIVRSQKTNAFKGYIGIEYSGNTLGEHEGIRATKKLLERYRLV